ncbi:uncharacterized protein PRCAT00005796001 [Priceomyces carsonii]|uniref:uncharacterized protein n=1 Tax=Priceomyces carsonii TaxID=28549 RepID=UPI002ED8B2D1|nr:unnamed protein product [Priceomyces carsonii]
MQLIPLLSKALVLSFGLFQAVQSVPTYPFSDSNSFVGLKAGRAIYFQTNEHTNSIVALKILENGTLVEGTITATGGLGASSISSATNITASPDGLSSQGSVTVAGTTLFAVNAGDNTVSMFSIDEVEPTNLKLLGGPSKVPGEFPVTVAASTLNRLVCVGTSGKKAGVSCAPYSPYVGIGELDFLRPFDLDQSTPPVGPLNTVSQTYFSADESLLITSVKGDSAINKTGFVSVYSVVGPSLLSQSRLSAGEIRSVVNGTGALFGLQQIPESDNYFIADASFGAAIISVNEMTQASEILFKQDVPQQMATCWVAISSSSNSAFVTDPLVNHIVEMSLADASIVSVINTTSSNDATGYIDIAAAGDYVYALSPGSKSGSGAEIGVLSVSDSQNKSIIQSLNVNNWAGSSAQGLAIYP